MSTPNFIINKFSHALNNNNILSLKTNKISSEKNSDAKLNENDEIDNLNSEIKKKNIIIKNY